MHRVMSSVQIRALVAYLFVHSIAAFHVLPVGLGVVPCRRAPLEHQYEGFRSRPHRGRRRSVSWDRLSRITFTSPNVVSKLHLQRDQLPDETLRELEEGDRRIKELEEEYWKSLSPEELARERKCASGLAHLRMGLLDKAAEDYLSAEELRYIAWQQIVNILSTWHDAWAYCLKFKSCTVGASQTKPSHVVRSQPLARSARVIASGVVPLAAPVYSQGIP